MKALLPILLALGACQASSGAVSELLAADRAFAADTQARRLDGWLAAFDANGSQVGDDFAPITGELAIRAWMTDFFADPANELRWEPDHAQVSEGGRLGQTSGRFRMTRRAPDGKVEWQSEGRYFDVWRKLPDGAWRLLYDIGDPDAGR
jgi:ketosteroid isomerase-like protein